MAQEFLKVNIENENGETEQAEILLQFTIKQFSNKKYVIYTCNEKDGDGNVILYSAMIVPDEEGFVFKKIETEEEWSVIKELIKHMSRQDGEE